MLNWLFPTRTARLAWLTMAIAGAALFSFPAQAYWRGGIWFSAPVAPYYPPLPYGPPPVVYAPPPPAYYPYAPPVRVWIAAHWGPWGWVPGHWEYR